MVFKIEWKRDGQMCTNKQAWLICTSGWNHVELGHDGLQLRAGSLYSEGGGQWFNSLFHLIAKPTCPHTLTQTLFVWLCFHLSNKETWRDLVCQTSPLSAPPFNTEYCKLLMLCDGLTRGYTHVWQVRLLWLTFTIKYPHSLKNRCTLASMKALRNPSIVFLLCWEPVSPEWMCISAVRPVWRLV